MKKRLTSVATASILAIASLALALPANAASFGGYVTWCAPKYLSAQGTSGPGTMTVSAPGNSSTTTQSYARTQYVYGNAPVGNWAAHGTAVTSGAPFCS